MTDKITNIDQQNSNEAGSSREIFPEGDAMDRFVRVFETSARRWELIIYPAMLAFVVLAGYGFFLIYTLSKDISTLARVWTRRWANISAISRKVLFTCLKMYAP